MKTDQMLRLQILEALQAKYQGQIEEGRCNIEIYLSNPAGIGEHPEILEAIDSQISKIVEAQEKKQALSWFD